MISLVLLKILCSQVCGAMLWSRFTSATLRGGMRMSAPIQTGKMLFNMFGGFQCVSLTYFFWIVFDVATANQQVRSVHATVIRGVRMNLIRDDIIKHRHYDAMVFASPNVLHVDCVLTQLLCCFRRGNWERI